MDRPVTQGALDFTPAPTEAEKRDAALDLLERTRADLIALARVAARDYAKQWGYVTSVDVVRLLRMRGHGHLLDAVDNRALGCVFRGGWERDGYESTGSHCRQVSRWKLKP